MSSLFQEKKATFFFFLTLLFILLAVLYIVFLRPLATDLKSAESNLQSLEAEIEKLEQQLSDDPEAESQLTFLLKKKIPLTRELRELLLSIQEIELVSGSRIESIQFNYDENFKENDADDNQEEDNAEQTEEESAQTTKKSNNPEKLKRVTAELIVISPDYDHFMQFIKEVEQLERITLVEGLEFVKPAEAEMLLLEKPNNTIAFNLRVATFYYEE